MNMNMNPILLLTEKDPWGPPIGGQTTFAKHLITAFGSRLAVSSHCDDKAFPVGKWIKRSYTGRPIWFLNRGLINDKKDKKPLIPQRFFFYLKAIKLMPQLRKMKFDGILIDSPEMLFAAYPYSWESVCFRFAGVNNPVANSRYPWARILGGCFERYFIACLKSVNPDVIIAAADHAAIDDFFQRTSMALDRSRFHQFPTRVDTELFHPIDILDARRDLNISLLSKVFVATGRLCWIKGWDLLLESLVYIKKQHPDSLMIFVGDGEDHQKLEEMAKELGVYENIRVTGFVPQSDVVRYMNAADVCVVASHREGWSLAMCEMIACGKSAVSTDVSGARDMIMEGLNGYVVSNRNPAEYSKQVCRALELSHAAKHSLQLADRYSLKKLYTDLTAIWSALKC